MGPNEPSINELEALFEKPFIELPENLQTLVLSAFFPMSWDALSADQRRNMARQIDSRQDLAIEAERKYWWDFFERKSALEKLILEWESTAAPTASDLLIKEEQLANLRSELAQMANQERHAQGNSSAKIERTIQAASPCQPAISGDISWHFRVIYDRDKNNAWWKQRMRDAKRNGLLKCRVGEGRKGPGGSLWRPDMVAGWLVDRWHKKKQGLNIDEARSALLNFPGCQEMAETNFSADE